MDTTYPVVSTNPIIQSRYNAMRDAGESHNMADMLAHRKGPSLVTDTSWWRGYHNGAQFENCPHIGTMRKNAAEHQGVSVNGKVYLGQLAEFPNDPRAWVCGRSDIKRICEERGWGCEGAVETTARRDSPPVADVPVADDIVADRAERLMEADPGLTAELATEQAYLGATGQL